MGALSATLYLLALRPQAFSFDPQVDPEPVQHAAFLDLLDALLAPIVEMAAWAERDNAMMDAGV
jgi:hypothetical protein